MIFNDYTVELLAAKKDEIVHGSMKYNILIIDTLK